MRLRHNDCPIHRSRFCCGKERARIGRRACLGGSKIRITEELRSPVHNPLRKRGRLFKHREHAISLASPWLGRARRRLTKYISPTGRSSNISITEPHVVIEWSAVV